MLLFTESSRWKHAMTGCTRMYYWLLKLFCWVCKSFFSFLTRLPFTPLSVIPVNSLASYWTVRSSWEWSSSLPLLQLHNCTHFYMNQILSIFLSSEFYFILSLKMAFASKTILQSLRRNSRPHVLRLCSLLRLKLNSVPRSSSDFCRRSRSSSFTLWLDHYLSTNQQQVYQSWE